MQSWKNWYQKKTVQHNFALPTFLMKQNNADDCLDLTPEQPEKQLEDATDTESVETRRSFLRKASASLLAGGASMMGIGNKEVQGQITDEQLDDPETQQRLKEIEKMQEERGVETDGSSAGTAPGFVVEKLWEALQELGYNQGFRNIGGRGLGALAANNRRGAIIKKVEGELDNITANAKSENHTTSPPEAVDAALKRMKSVSKNELKSARYAQQVMMDIATVMDWMYLLYGRNENLINPLHGKPYARLALLSKDLKGLSGWLDGSKLKAADEAFKEDREKIDEEIEPETVAAKEAIKTANESKAKTEKRGEKESEESKKNEKSEKEKNEAMEKLAAAEAREKRHDEFLRRYSVKKKVHGSDEKDLAGYLDIDGITEQEIQEWIRKYEAL